MYVECDVVLIVLKTKYHCQTLTFIINIDKISSTYPYLKNSTLRLESRYMTALYDKKYVWCIQLKACPYKF